MDDLLQVSIGELVVINQGAVCSSVSSPAWPVVCIALLLHDIQLFFSTNIYIEI